MKRKSIIIIASLICLFSLGLTTSCKQNENAKDAAITLKVSSTSASSVTFEITTENASTYSYAFGKSADISNAEYLTEDAQNGSPVKIEKAGLEEETEYAIKAYATNADGKDCAEISETAITTSSASVSIENVAVTPESITFRLVPMNAVSVQYAVAGPGDNAESIELSRKTDNGSEQEITEGFLEPGTNYTIVATATNSSQEESKRAYLTAKTDIEPIIEIIDIDAESDQAKVRINVEEATQFAWACAEKGAEIPARESFNKVTISMPENSFIISQLADNTEYTLYLYGVTRYNYEGIIHEQDFTTEEYVEKPFEITVSDTWSTDAIYSIIFDESVYSEYYYVVGSQSAIKDTDDWDWIQKVDNPKPLDRLKPEMLAEDLIDGRVSDFGRSQLILESIYYIGGIPRKISGELDTTAIIWRQVQLEPVEFGQNSIELSINDVKPRLDAVSFNTGINSEEDLDAIFMMVTRGTIENESDAQSYINSALVSDPYYNFAFGKDTVVNYLSDESDYVIVMAARDKNGGLSEIAYETFATMSVNDQGNASCSVELSEISTNAAIFDISMDQGTSEVLYHYAAKDEYYDEESFLRSLKKSNKKSIAENGKFEIEGLSSETDYVFGFCALDENGIQGKHYLIEESTLAHAYDGNPQAKVEVTIDKFTVGDYGRYYAVISAVPNEHVSRYYIEIADDNNASYLTKSSFADDCLSGQNDEYSSSVTLSGRDGNGESCAANATVWVLAIDTDGKLCPIFETRIDETWE